MTPDRWDIARLHDGCDPETGCEYPADGKCPKLDAPGGLA